MTTNYKINEWLSAADFKMFEEINVSYGVLDNACWARTGVTEPSIEEELNSVLIEKKLVPFAKSSKGRLKGANAFKQRLIGNEMKDGEFKPAIYFFKTCYNCLRTIPMIGHDKHNPDLPDTRAEDHCYDAVSYGIGSRPFTPMRPKKKRDVYDAWKKKEKPQDAWTY